MRTETVKTVAATLAAALLVGAVGALVFIYSGVYNVAASEPHLGVVRWAMNTLQERSVAVRGGSVPEAPPVDSAGLEEGFHHFAAMCVMCHGAPGVERGELGQGMNPKPPRLGRKAADYTARELFWIAKHGIKMAGMPAFGVTHSDSELWNIVAFVERLPEMSPEEYEEWEAREDEAGTAATGDGHGHEHQDGH